jgi:hypothetical protein
MKIEAKWNTLLNQYFRKTKFYCYYELKQTNKETFNLSEIRVVQWEGAPATEESGLVWKLSDETSRPKPIDGLSTPPLPSYLIIKFKDGFYFLRFKLVAKIRDSGEKTISKKLAEELSDKIIKLK